MVAVASPELTYFNARRELITAGLASQDESALKQAWGAAIDLVDLPRVLTGGMKLVLRSVLKHVKAAQGWAAQVRVDWMSATASCSRRTTQRRLRALEGMGLVVRDPVLGSAARYRVDPGALVELVEDDLTATELQRRERRAAIAASVARLVEEGRVREARPTSLDEARRGHLERGRRGRGAAAAEGGSSEGAPATTPGTAGLSSPASARDGIPAWLPAVDKLPGGYTRQDCYDLVVAMVALITGTERAPDGADWNSVRRLWKAQGYLRPDLLLGAMRGLVEAATTCASSPLFAFLRGETPRKNKDGTVSPTMVTPRSVRFYCQPGYWRMRLDATELHLKGECRCRAHEQAPARPPLPPLPPDLRAFREGTVTPADEVDWLVQAGVADVDADLDHWWRRLQTAVPPELAYLTCELLARPISHDGGLVIAWNEDAVRDEGVDTLGAVLTEAATAIGLRLGVLYEATAPPA